MRASKPRCPRAACWMGMVLASALLLGPFLWAVKPEKPAHYTSAHPASTAAPLMGFSPESVINVGTAEEIDAIPGIGEVYSQRIVEGRAILGDYRLPTDLLLVKGIGEKRLAAILEALDEPLVELSAAWE